MDSYNKAAIASNARKNAIERVKLARLRNFKAKLLAAKAMTQQQLSRLTNATNAARNRLKMLNNRNIRVNEQINNAVKMNRRNNRRSNNIR